ncbi:MAG TPA: hypothetical protein VFA66_07005 [Gaiellaceae bacterium]|nr:hypothetical protein [Gaiellaceae bacterium]
MKAMISMLGAVAALFVAAGALAATRGDRTPVDGVYRVTWTEKQAIAAGAPFRSAHADFGFAHGKPVVIEITLRGGSFSLRDTSARPACRGTYAVAGVAISIDQTTGCFGRVSARWSLHGTVLRLHVTRATDPGDVVVFGAKPWRKIARESR